MTGFHLLVTVLCTVATLLANCAMNTSTATDDYSKVELSKADRCASLVQKNSNSSSLAQRLEGMVGVGWDSLLNVETLPILAMTYRDCRTTPDGVVLLPDNVAAEAVFQTSMDRMATFYESYDSYTRSTSKSINAKVWCRSTGNALRYLWCGLGTASKML